MMTRKSHTEKARPASAGFKPNRLAQFFSASPKTRDPAATSPMPPSAQQALLAAMHNGQPPTHQIKPPALSLPTISLSTASVGETNRSDIVNPLAVTGAEPGPGFITTTLFEPPSDDAQSRLQRRRETQFGPLLHPSHLHVSSHPGGPLDPPIIDEPPYYYIITTYICYLLLILIGHYLDFVGRRFGNTRERRSFLAQNGYAPLNDDFDSFYTRHLKQRLDDCFARPTTGVPGRYITLLDRVSHDRNRSYVFTGAQTETLNMSSYNYLGFAHSEGPCADAVEEVVRRYGVSSCSPRADAGTNDLALEVEREVAAFLGKPAAMVFSMGFVANSSTFPALVSKGCLVLSDELNHASIRVGARQSGAVIQSFRHNNVEDLERRLREAISQGQPRTHRPWKKILVAVEGLYSMEGTMVDLPRIVSLKRRYKFYLFLDEAHSIGALGRRGRGVCDYFGVDPAEVDVMMGTFTKSFGSNGGYVAAEPHIIDKLRATNAAALLAESTAPCVLMQILSALRIITGELCPGEGEERLQRIAFNSRYLRLGLRRLGFIVYGHDDSPIIPVLMYHPSKLSAWSHQMLRHRISVVVVGYPATPLISCRARFCVSASHNKDDLDRLLAACDEIGDMTQLKYSSGIAGGLDDDGQARRIAGAPYKPPRWKLKDIIARGIQDAKAPTLR